MRVRIARRTHLIIAVLEYLGALCGKNRIDERAQISAHGVFQPHGRVDPARDEAVELILHASGADGVIGQKVLDIGRVFGIEHLVRRRQARFLHRRDMQGADTADPPHDVLRAVGIGLDKHTLIPYALRARLVGVNSRHEHQLVLHPFVEPAEAGNILQHGCALVR